MMTARRPNLLLIRDIDMARKLANVPRPEEVL